MHRTGQVPYGPLRELVKRLWSFGGRQFSDTALYRAPASGRRPRRQGSDARMVTDVPDVRPPEDWREVVSAFSAIVACYYAGERLRRYVARSGCRRVHSSFMCPCRNAARAGGASASFIRSRTSPPSFGSTRGCRLAEAPSDNGHLYLLRGRTIPWSLMDLANLPVARRLGTRHLGATLRHSQPDARRRCARAGLCHK